MIRGRGIGASKTGEESEQITTKRQEKTSSNALRTGKLGLKAVTFDVIPNCKLTNKKFYGVMRQSDYLKATPLISKCKLKLFYFFLQMFLT